MQPILRALVPLLVAGPVASCKAVHSVVGPSSATQSSASDAVFSDLVRYADLLFTRLKVATREFEKAANSPEADLQSAKWRLEFVSSLTQHVGQPSSISGLLDMVVVASVGRSIHEDYWIPEVYGEADRPLAVAFQNCEEDGWALLERHLKKEQFKEVREVFDRWHERNPKVTPETLLEFPSFLSLMQQDQRVASDSSLFGLVGLDPLSSLEPMARQVELSRMLGQRALFFATHAPFLVGAEVDVRILEARGTREMHQVLANVDAVSRSIERLAALGEKLPEVIRAEREGIVRDVSTLERPLSTLLQQSQSALDSVAKGSASLTETVNALDRFVENAKGEEKPDDTPSKPFDVTEYGVAAGHLGAAARDVTVLLSTLDQRLPEVQKVLDETATQGRATIDRALYGVLLVGIGLIVAATVASILKGRLAPRSSAPG